MKVVHLVPPPCDCRANLERFRREQGGSWGHGTIIECECGATWAWTRETDGHAMSYWKRRITNDQLQDR